MKDDKQLQQWKNCAPGAISNLAEQRRISRWQSIISKISSSVIAGAAVVTLCTVFVLNSGTGSKLRNSSGTPAECDFSIKPISCENVEPVSYTHLRAHETGRNLVCRLLLEKKK